MKVNFYIDKEASGDWTKNDADDDVGVKAIWTTNTSDLTQYLPRIGDEVQLVDSGHHDYYKVTRVKVTMGASMSPVAQVYIAVP